MNKRILYLHVGPHKTGTTVLQKACLDNREVLEAHGIKYPNLFFSHIGHHALVDIIRKKEITEEVLSKIENLDSDIIFSSENFISLTKEHWSYFFSFFTEYDIRIIYSWRRSSQKMYSLWQESIKQGGIKSFTDFYYKELIRPGQSVLLCPHIRLDMWTDILGKEKIQILDYDASKSSGSLISDFFNLLSIDNSSIITEKLSPGVKNESLPPEVVEIIRSLNRVFSLNNKQSSYVRVQFYNQIDNINEEIKLISNIMSHYCESLTVGNYFIDKVSEKKLIDGYRSNIVNYKENRKTSSIKIVSPDWLLDHKSNQIIHAICNKLGLKQLDSHDIQN